MTITTKVGTGALVASSIAGLGAIASRHFGTKEGTINAEQQKTKISDLIEEKYDYILLNTQGTEDNSYWNTNWENYKQDSSKKDKDIFELDGWTKENTPDLKEQLKEKCKDLANTSILANDNETYENFAKYCSRSVEIRDQAKKEGLKILKDSGDVDWSIWSKRSKTKMALKKELEAFKIGVGNLVDAYKIRDICKSITSTNKKDVEYTNIFNAYKRVCAKQSDEQ